SGSCSDRRPPASAGSSWLKSGRSLASTRPCGGVDGPVRMPVIELSSSTGDSASLDARISRIWVTWPRTRIASLRCRAPTNWSSERCQPFMPASRLVLHGGPQSGGVQPGHIGFDLVLVAGRHHGPALVVYIKHQLGGHLATVPEQLLEDVGDIG